MPKDRLNTYHDGDATHARKDHILLYTLTNQSNGSMFRAVSLTIGLLRPPFS